MSDKVIALGVCGAGRSVRSWFNIKLINGITYLEIEDHESGQNIRTAKIALSGDKMLKIGTALTAIGELGVSLDGLNEDGFNRVTKTVLK